jgi:predicted PurR-regulated permease PerM
MKFSMRETVELTVQRVFFRAVVMFSVHMMATLALFTLLDLRFALAASAAAGFFAIFPYVSGLIMFAPVLVALVSFSYPLYAYLYFAVVLVIVFYVLDPFVDELFPMEYPQITALSAVLGIYAFGFSGFILGPVLVSMVASFIATYQWYEKLAKQVADGASGLPTRDVSMSSSVLSKSTQMAQFQAGGLFGSVWGMFAVLSVVFIIIPITVRVSA